MKAITLLFPQRVGIELSSSPDYILQLDCNENVINHVGSMHASASYSLAETTSGYFLQTSFSEIADQTIPILRTSTVKYKKGGYGTIFSTAKLLGSTVKEVLALLEQKRKALLSIQVKLYNSQKEIIAIGDFEWFVTLK